MKNRRSLTPSTGDAVGDVHATRRGGARHELSSRVTLTATTPLAHPRATPTLEGWALNVSRGGVRVILEESVELGAEFEVTLITLASLPAAPAAPAAPPATEARDGTAATSRVGRVVWVQEEHDGVIVGIEFRGDTPVPKADP